MAEQPTFDFRQWQNALDLSVRLGEEKMGAVPKRCLHNGFPARAVEEGGLWA